MFCARIAAPEILAAPGAIDALGACLVAQAGFGAAYMTGLGATASRLCMPDLGLMTQTEMAEQARAMCRATDIPVIAEADTGEALEELKANGTEVSELSAEEMAKLRDLVAPVYEARIDTVGKENFDLLMAELNKLRGNRSCLRYGAVPPSPAPGHL